MMLRKPRSSKGSKFKMAWAIPALFVAGLLTSWQLIPEAAPQDPYKVVDQMPEYPGGKDAMISYMIKETKYPAQVKKGEPAPEGTVHVGFVIGTDGKVTKVRALKEVHPALDAEAIRVVSGMPNWKPGKHKGNVVPVEMVLPVKFVMPPPPPPAPPAKGSAPTPPDAPTPPTPPSKGSK